MGEDVVYQAVEIPAGDFDEGTLTLDAPLPAETLVAAQNARGALLRTLFVASDAQGRLAACLGYHRPHTAQLKLCALSGVADLYDGLLAYASQYAGARDLVLKTELGDLAPAATAAFEQRARVEHYRQTTDFTCGAVATLDAHKRLGLCGALNRTDEIALWREATMVVACDPYGLALASARHGCTPAVYVSKTGCVLEPKKDSFGLTDPVLARDIQLAFEARVHEEHIPVHVGAFSAVDIARALDEGHVVIVLVDEIHWHGERCPHWVTVVRHEGNRFFIDDPWCDLEFGESAIDAYELAVDADDLDLVSSYEGVQSMLVF